MGYFKQLDIMAEDIVDSMKDAKVDDVEMELILRLALVKVQHNAKRGNPIYRIKKQISRRRLLTQANIFDFAFERYRAAKTKRAKSIWGIAMCWFD